MLKDEGWFDFLHTPKTKEEISEHFQDTDTELLQIILDSLTKENILLQNKTNQYKDGFIVDEYKIAPSIFTENMQELFHSYAAQLPNRLRNFYTDFDGGFNLYNWDDALASRVYEQIRRAAFAYTKALNYHGAFLDVGAGPGYGTTAIWCDYYRKKTFENGHPMQIYAVEPMESFLNIANTEFVSNAAKLLKEKRETIQAMQEYHPRFIRGQVESLPFEDETFDLVYASQVLHWTDIRVALKEMLRVTKKDGMIFGTQNFYPSANAFNDLHFKVIRGAHGFIHKEELKSLVKELGGKKLETATPISIFKITK